MLEFLTLKQEAFGLDISDSFIKIVKLKPGKVRVFPLRGKKGKNFFKPASFGEEKIKEGIIQRGEVKKEKALIDVIQKAISACQGEKLKTNYVIASLPEEKSFLEIIQMPLLPEEDLRSAIVYQVENYIPLPLEEVYLDFQVIQPPYNHLDHQDILLAAFPKKIVDSYCFCLKKAGLKPLALEAESQAIVRALIKDEISYQPVLIVDFGQTRTSFVIFSGHSLKFTSSIPVSGQHFTQLISKNLGVSFAEAEKLKVRYGLKEKVKIGLKKDGFEKKAEGGRIFEALIPVLADLVQQIKRYLNFYLTHTSHEHLPPNGNKGVKKIILCGNGASLKGFSSFLSLQLKIPVESGNPWINILPEGEKEPREMPREKALGYTTALGLALRGAKKLYD